MAVAGFAGCGDNLGNQRDGAGGDDGADGPTADGPTVDGVPVTIPMVESTIPDTDATMVARNTSVSVRFSEAMDRSTLDGTSFTLTVGTPPVTVPGTVVSTNRTATFWPTVRLLADTEYEATITTAAESAAQVPLAAPHMWSFMTGSTTAPGLPVDLGTAGDFALLAKSGITTVPSSDVTGHVGVSPIAATAIVGFDLIMDASNEFARSTQVTGRVYASDYSPPTPTYLTTAIGDMEIAFSDAAARAPDVIDLGAGTVGSVTLAPGVYRWATDLLIPTSIILDGNATDVWIFQIAGNLTVATGVNVTLAGNANPKNIFWQVAGAATIGTTAHLEGSLLSMTTVIFDTGASLNGRMLAQTAVTLRAATVVKPAP